MGLVCPELSLDLKPQNYINENNIKGLLNEIRSKGDNDMRWEVDGFVERLQQEMLKIQGFQRELPLCMLLLQHAIEALKTEKMECESREGHQPVLEEFIPLNTQSQTDNKSFLQTKDKQQVVPGRDKKDWMSSVQLWNTAPSLPAFPCSTSKEDAKPTKIVSDDLLLNDVCPPKNKAPSKGFVPLLPEFRRKSLVVKEDGSSSCRADQGLAIMSPATLQINTLTRDQPSFSCTLGVGGGGGAGRVCDPLPARGSSPHPSSRKQRRCWSPELHRRFVDALTQLGGPNVATPKQIREMMRVDGLTNDEVKSHLQKYRLHAKRVACNSVASATENDSGVATSWSNQDHYNDSSKPTNSQSRSPEGPFQFPGHTAGNSTNGGDNMEDEDDEKSESYNCKEQEHIADNDDV